ncbi:XkdX family protein [Acetobacterium wieringae]|nr:XkdX family protein [Acetobacterium wieringae]MEA4805069.1 XkdX family protein [Acetobacterium wieringae]
MYERLLYLYGQGRLTAAQLDIAVSKGWITEEEKAKIIASKAA